MRTLPSDGVVQASHQGGDRGLAGARRTHERQHLPGLDPERHVVQDGHRWRRVSSDGHGLERREGHLARRRVAEPDLLELDGRGATHDGLGVGLLDDHRGQVEDLEDAVEGDQGGHDVDPDVRQCGERTVEPAQQPGQGDERARS